MATYSFNWIASDRQREQNAMRTSTADWSLKPGALAVPARFDIPHELRHNACDFLGSFADSLWENLPFSGSRKVG